jgi:hypothetical protein
MPEDRAAATDLPHGTFADGQAEPDRFAADERVGAFSDGEAQPLGNEEAGRFSEGVEQRADAEPEKHVEGRFSDESPEPS